LLIVKKELTGRGIEEQQFSQQTAKIMPKREGEMEKKSDISIE